MRSGSGRPTRRHRAPRRATAAARRPTPSVQAQRLGDLAADPHHRVERRPRVLEHHGDLLAAQPSCNCRSRAAERAPRRRSGRCPVTVASSGARPTIASAVSVLPDPDSPMTPSRPPSTISNETPSTTRRPPISTVSPSTSSSAITRPAPPAIGHRRRVLIDDAREHGRRRRRPPAQPRVDGVAQAVAEQVEPERRRRPPPGPGNTSVPGCTVIDCCSDSSIRPHDGVDTGVSPR